MNNFDVTMSKETAIEPKMQFEEYNNMGLAIMRKEFAYCPRCSHILNAGPNYQPKLCNECGQRIDFSAIKWGEAELVRRLHKGDEGYYNIFEDMEKIWG